MDRSQMKSIGAITISAPVPTELSALSVDELIELSECDELVEEFVMKLPQLATLTRQCDALTTENRELAKGNLALNGEFETTRDKTLQNVGKLSELNGSFEALTEQSADLSQKLQPSILQEHMSIAAAQSEEESEAIANKFLESDLTVESFLKTYMEKRKETHLRKFKGDRLGAQLFELQKAGF